MAERSQTTNYVKRVLVVEDDHQLADLLIEVLTFENCQVDVADNGIEALDQLRINDYDAVICDLVMPGLDGAAVYREATRDQPDLADRFLFITGQASHRAGFSDFVAATGNQLLTKPFSVEELREALPTLFR